MLSCYWKLWVPLLLYVEASQLAKDGSTALQDISNRVNSYLESIKNGIPGSKQQWSLEISHLRSNFLQSCDGDTCLCLILSRIPHSLLTEPSVQMALSELELFHCPERQLRCISNPVTKPDLYTDHERFLKRLPIIHDPHEWHWILRAYVNTKDKFIQDRLLRIADGLWERTDHPSFMGQFCSLDLLERSAKSEDEAQLFKSLIGLLPVFTTLNGQEFLKKVKEHDPCKQFNAQTYSSLYRELIVNARASLNNGLQNVTFPPDFYDKALANPLSIEALLQFLRQSIVMKDLGSLARIIDASDLLLQRVQLDDIILIAAHLVNPTVPPELFVLFFNRIGQLLKHEPTKYLQFLNEALTEAKNFDSFIKWYIELTKLEPKLIGYGKNSIHLWDHLMRPWISTKAQHSGLKIKAPDDLKLLEAILFKTRALTAAPLIEPQKIEAIKRAVLEIGLNPAELLKNGLWRTAALLEPNDQIIQDYLRGPADHLLLRPVSWALNRLSEKDKREQIAYLKTSPNISIRALVYLFSNSGTPEYLCRKSGGKKWPIQSKLLNSVLKQQDASGNLVFPSFVQLDILRALIALMGNISIDELQWVTWGELPSEELFVRIIKSYCSQWWTLSPALVVERDPGIDNLTLDSRLKPDLQYDGIRQEKRQDNVIKNENVEEKPIVFVSRNEKRVAEDTFRGKPIQSVNRNERIAGENFRDKPVESVSRNERIAVEKVGDKRVESINRKEGVVGENFRGKPVEFVSRNERTAGENFRGRSVGSVGRNENRVMGENVGLVDRNEAEDEVDDNEEEEEEEFNDNKEEEEEGEGEFDDNKEEEEGEEEFDDNKEEKEEGEFDDNEEEKEGEFDDNEEEEEEEEFDDNEEEEEEEGEFDDNEEEEEKEELDDNEEEEEEEKADDNQEIVNDNEEKKIDDNEDNEEEEEESATQESEEGEESITQDD